MKKCFTMINNETMEALINNELNSTELKIMLVVIRYTYGYQREECCISLDFITKATGKSKRGIINGIKSLCDKGYIIKKQLEGERTLCYSLGEKYRPKWHTELPRNSAVYSTLGVQETSPKRVNNSSPEAGQYVAHNKYNNINKNNKYNIKSHSKNCVPTPKSTSFSNFTPSGDIDYRALEMRALQKALGHLKNEE